MKIKTEVILLIAIIFLMLVSFFSIKSCKNAVKEKNELKNNYISYQDSLLNMRRNINLNRKNFAIFEKSLYDSIEKLNIKPKNVKEIVKWRTNYVMDTIIDTIYIKDTTNKSIGSYSYDDGCFSFSQSFIWDKNIIKTFDINYNSESMFIAYRQRPVSIFFKKEVRWFWKRKQNFIRIETTCGDSYIEKIINIKK